METAVLDLHIALNALLANDIGWRDWPLQHYTRAWLFRVAALRGWLDPDFSPI